MNEKTARLRLADAIQNLIKVHMKWSDKKSRLWMTTDNPNLGEVSPVELILRGRAHKVLMFVESSISEDKP